MCYPVYSTFRWLRECHIPEELVVLGGLHLALGLLVLVLVLDHLDEVAGHQVVEGVLDHFGPEDLVGVLWPIILVHDAVLGCYSAVL